MATKNGNLGANTIWDGPLSQEGRPHKKGSSSGPNGMQVSKYPCKSYELQGPITQRAKGK